MGKLRQLAEAEVAQRERDCQERRAREEERKEREHRDCAKPAAEFLARWSGEPVDADWLERADDTFPGFHAYLTWAVTVDGFELLVKQERRHKAMLEEHTPDWLFEIHQLLSDGTLRRISDPADLLAPSPVSIKAGEVPSDG